MWRWSIMMYDIAAEEGMIRSPTNVLGANTEIESPRSGRSAICSLV